MAIGGPNAELFIRASQGNPGAMTVLVDLWKKDDAWTRLLMKKIEQTNTKAPNLWLVYKDETKGNLEMTKEHLEKWLKGPDVSLGQWISERDWACSAEAKYYS